MAIKRLKPKWMSVGWFVALPDHPRQRDTERHTHRYLGFLPRLCAVLDHIAHAHFDRV